MTNDLKVRCVTLTVTNEPRSTFRQGGLNVFKNGDCPRLVSVGRCCVFVVLRAKCCLGEIICTGGERREGSSG